MEQNVKHKLYIGYNGIQDDHSTIMDFIYNSLPLLEDVVSKITLDRTGIMV